MKNREKFREQILEFAIAPGRDICDFRRNEVLSYFGKGCGGISCSWCSLLLNLWLDEEYKEPPKPEVDWSNVPVDTLVRVRDREDKDWILRYFKGINDKQLRRRYEAWESGATSKTANGEYLCWDYCELVEDEDNGK